MNRQWGGGKPPTSPSDLSLESFNTLQASHAFFWITNVKKAETLMPRSIQPDAQGDIVFKIVREKFVGGEPRNFDKIGTATAGRGGAIEPARPA